MSSTGLLQPSGSVRTIFIFTDLPSHIEFRAGDFPLLASETVVMFNAVLKNPRDPKKSRHIEGPYKVQRAILKYETGRPGMTGLTQYIEWEPAES